MTERDVKLMGLAAIGRFDTAQGEMVVYLDSLFPCDEPHFHVGDAATYPDCTNFHTYYSIGRLYPLDDYEELPEEALPQLYELLKSEWQYLLETWNKQNPVISLPLDTPLPERVRKSYCVKIYLNSHDDVDSPLPATRYKVYVQGCRDREEISIYVRLRREDFCVNFNIHRANYCFPQNDHLCYCPKEIQRELSQRLQDWLREKCRNQQFDTNRAYAIYNYRIANSK